MVKKINTRRKTRKTLKRRYQKKSKRRYQRKSKRRSRKMRGGSSAGGGGGDLPFKLFVEPDDPEKPTLAERNAMEADIIAKEKLEEYNKEYAKTYGAQNTLNSLIEALKRDYKAPLEKEQDNLLEIILLKQILLEFYEDKPLTGEIVKEAQKRAQLAKYEVLKKA